MATTVLEFGVETPAKAPNTVVFVGKKEALQNDKLLPLLGGIDKPVRDQMLKDVSVGDNGASISTYVTAEGKLTKIVLSVLPSKNSRHNSAFQPHAISSLIGAATGGASARVSVLLEEEWQVAPIACAIARAFPLFSSKQRPADDPDAERVVSVDFLAPDLSRVTDPAR
eukprot:CAMPEP_0172184774 /NCGR_PEP_ID=MMETSP1050-20130122/19776_1 /TAXON_ID=233186 /ORGANISM="Cryptomonas curvata, Strain CCAP979/52" /LENGTH=168 /DNA_ID=CAMNT_0012858637 /DNA_START=259 /DNA_END=762 /DNA_ORIENTATION=+